ncbi:hypothetical protein V6N12_031597 [Hibiscus sabdariffa]|uniref:Uncharacterized protein n=1 Tax=Hibiscus sabdariffa TaxID=183260 RepID=A0ABR2DWJ8_9ROSI
MTATHHAPTNQPRPSKQPRPVAIELTGINKETYGTIHHPSTTYLTKAKPMHPYQRPTRSNENTYVAERNPHLGPEQSVSKQSTYYAAKMTTNAKNKPYGHT